MMTHEQHTRRNVLALAGGTAAVGLAGCLGGNGDSAEDRADEQTRVIAERDAYVVTYHWGFAAFNENGDEIDLIEVDPNTELTLHVVNDHASDGVEELPDPVAAELEDFDALAQTKAKVEAGELPEPGEGIEEAYNEAHGGGHGHDDGHDDDHDDGHDDDHDDAMLEHGLMIGEFGVDIEAPGDMHEPATATFVTEEPGTYQARCTVACGYGHTYQQEDLIHVTED